MAVMKIEVHHTVDIQFDNTGNDGTVSFVSYGYGDEAVDAACNGSQFFVRVASSLIGLCNADEEKCQIIVIRLERREEQQRPISVGALHTMAHMVTQSRLIDLSSVLPDTYVFISLPGHRVREFDELCINALEDRRCRWVNDSVPYTRLHDLLQSLEWVIFFWKKNSQ